MILMFLGNFCFATQAGNPIQLMSQRIIGILEEFYTVDHVNDTLTERLARAVRTLPEFSLVDFHSTCSEDAIAQNMRALKAGHGYNIVMASASAKEMRRVSEAYLVMADAMTVVDAANLLQGTRKYLPLADVASTLVSDPRVALIANFVSSHGLSLDIPVPLDDQE